MRKRSERLLTFATIAYTLAVATLLAAVISGIILIKRTGTCEDTFRCVSDEHPLVGVGFAVLLAGLVLAFVCFAVGYLCSTTSQLAKDAADLNGGQAGGR